MSEEQVLETEAIATDEKIEDTLYDNSEQIDEPADESKEETKDSEIEVTESSEAAETEETEETSGSEETVLDYKLELAENSRMDNSMLEAVTAYAKENNLSKDMAAGLLSKQEELLSSWVESKTEEMMAVRDSWSDAVRNDKVLGGDNLDKTIESARRVVDRFASEEFVGMLIETGYGDHPEVVRFLTKIGSLMENDTLITGKDFGGEKSTEDYFYGS